YNGDLDATANVNTELSYDPTKHSTIFPSSAVLTPGSANFPTSGTAPQITSSVNSASIGTNQLGSVQITATGSPAPAFSLVGAPTWVWIDSASGQLGFSAPANTTGSPFNFTIKASNGIGTDATQSFTLTVNNYTPVALTPGNLLVYRVGD